MKKLLILSLGSNIDPRKKFLDLAIIEIKKAFNVIKISNIYETQPCGYTNQNNFLNLSLACFTKLSPFETLKEIKRIEKDVGRKSSFKWGPREIDIDIIYYENVILKTQKLVIPHPYRLKRAFVAIPIFEIMPKVIDPEYKIPISKLINKFFSRSQISTLLRSKFL